VGYQQQAGAGETKSYIGHTVRAGNRRGDAVPGAQQQSGVVFFEQLGERKYCSLIYCIFATKRPKIRVHSAVITGEHSPERAWLRIPSTWTVRLPISVMSAAGIPQPEPLAGISTIHTFAMLSGHPDAVFGHPDGAAI
jgi:hypothetical protein